MSQPLLLANTEVYIGPWTPARELEGVLVVEGLVEGVDEIVIRIRDVDESAEDTIVTMQRSARVEIGKLNKVLLRAERTESSGAEVSVWVS